MKFLIFTTSIPKIFIFFRVEFRPREIDWDETKKKIRSANFLIINHNFIFNKVCDGRFYNLKNNMALPQ